MSIIYPANPSFNNQAERFVYSYIKEHLPNNYVCYFNYYIGHREFDVAILVPNVGVAILEIKGWTAEQIFKVEDNTRILTVNSNGVEIPWPSPFKQVNDYRYKFANRIKKELGIILPVLPVVCYPNISKEEFHTKRLDIVSPETCTLFKDDFSNENGVVKRLKVIGEAVNQNWERMTLENMVKVRRFFETEEQIAETLDLMEGKVVKKSPIQEKEHYSLLTYVPDSFTPEEVDERIIDCIGHWCKGTKILFFSNSEEVDRRVNEAFQKKVAEMNLEKQFCKEIFQFYAYKIEDYVGECFSIYNGDLDSIIEYEEQLKLFHEESDFNLDQYRVEHAPVNEHIVIKAGAGSGKTFSMISRIRFLIYIHEMDAEKLKEEIFLITFTNESASNMKQKLQENLYKYYLLTKDYDIFQMIEAVEEMKISTIHSLAKKILQKYAVKQGLGKDFSIVTGKYERDQVLAEVLDQYLIEKTEIDPQFISTLRLSMYHLQERLKAFLHKLENKNIDILRDELEFGYSPISQLDELLIEVLKRTEIKMRKMMDDQNSVRLSDLMIKLKLLLDCNKSEIQQHGIKYLFVDEFQDTDDVQIELMKVFQQILHFNFFVVGDIKQCIYRFRGAEDKAFDKLCEDTGYVFLPTFKLTKNYRSDSLLLQRFEKAFKKWGSGIEPNLEYKSEVDQLVSHNNYNNPTDLFFKKIEISDENNSEEIIKKFINEIETQYENLSERGKLAILVRDNKEVDKVREWGLENGHFIETDNGGSLYQLKPTLDLYKLVLAMQHPHSPKHLFNLYTTSFVTEPLNKGEIYKRKNNPKELMEFFYTENSIPNFKSYLDELKNEPVLYVLRNLLLKTNPWDNYASTNKLNEENQMKQVKYYKRNMDQLFEKLTTIGNQDYLTINKIEQFLRIMIMTKQKEENRESFQVDDRTQGKTIVCMTVHKSKGLEFETVLMPFVNKELDGLKKSGPIEVLINSSKQVGYKLRLDDKLGKSKYVKNNFYKEEEKVEKKLKVNEETRILYVAMTRAIKNFVYFFYENSSADNSWQLLIEEE